MKQKKLGKQSIRSTWSETTIKEKVESWNWNANIFEIYDEIRDWSVDDVSNVLQFAYKYFNKDNMINELHSHLIGVGVEDA